MEKHVLLERRKIRKPQTEFQNVCLKTFCAVRTTLQLEEFNVEGLTRTQFVVLRGFHYESWSSLPLLRSMYMKHRMITRIISKYCLFLFCFGVFLSFGSRAKGKGGNSGHLTKRCTAEAMTHYVEFTADWDGVETVTAETGTTIKGRCWDGYFWYPPACRDPWSPHRSQSSTTYPTCQHTACRYHTC